MKVSDVMTRDPQTIQAEATVHEAALLMRQADIGALPVYEGDVLVGIVTDRDVVVRCIAKGLSPNKTLVSEATTWEVEACTEDRGVQEAVWIMEEKKIRRLMVLDRDGRLVGIVSLCDIALKTHDRELVEEAMETIAQPF